MNKALQVLYRLIHRFRYPIAQPQEIGEALGVEASNDLSFDEFVHCLASPTCRPTRLCRFMPRENAEAAFKTAQKKERFQQDTLVSYCFHEGWVEFILHFDEQSRLRRIYLNHKQITKERGIEISLNAASDQAGKTALLCLTDTLT